MITVIVTAYNIENYIRKCLDSLLSQKKTGIEIILVDDGSTDKTGLICDDYKKYGVCVIHKKNGGPNSARKSGLDASKNNYVMFVDGDDWVQPNCIDILKKEIELDKPTDLLCFGMTYIKKEKSIESGFGVACGSYDKNDIEQFIYPRLIEDASGKHVSGSLCGKVFRKNILSEIFDNVNMGVRIGEDAAIVRPFILKCSSIKVIKESLYCYNRTNSNSVTSLLKPIDLSNTLQIRSDLIQAFGLKGDWRFQINRNTVHNLFISSISQFNSGKSYSENRDEINKILSHKFEENIFDSVRYSSRIWKIIAYILKTKNVILLYLIWRIRK